MNISEAEVTLKWAAEQLKELNMSGWNNDLEYTPVGKPVGMVAQDLSMSHLQYTVRNIQLYMAPCIACFGIVSNITCLAFLIHKPMLRLSTTHYIIAMLIADGLQLAFLLENWFNEFGLQLYFIGGWCQFTTFGRNVVIFLSCWSTVALAFDRFMCLSYPDLETIVCVPSMARVIIISTTVVATVVFLNTSLLFDVLQVGDHVLCHTISVFNGTMRSLGYADLFFNAFIPCTLIIVFTAITIGQLIYNKHLESTNQLRRKKHRYCTNQRRRSLHSYRASVTLEEDLDLLQDHIALCILFTFLLFTLPYHIFRITDSIKSVTQTLPLMEKLHSFLYSQILLHVKYTQLAVTSVVILLCHRGLRKRFQDKVICRRCINRSGLLSWDQEVILARVSDEISNDESSTVQIIRHEIQRHNSTAV